MNIVTMRVSLALERNPVLDGGLAGYPFQKKSSLQSLHLDNQDRHSDSTSDSSPSKLERRNTILYKFLKPEEYMPLFKDSKPARKIAITEARPAREGEIVKTTFPKLSNHPKVLKNSRLMKDPSFEETENTAQRGDMVVTGVLGENYIVREEKFKREYNKVGEGLYKPREDTPHRYVTRIVEDICFTAPWGEKKYAMSGSYLIKEGNGMYAVHEIAFGETYRYQD